MAIVIWTMRAHAEKSKLYVEGRLNFGLRIALKTAHRIEELQKKLERFPGLGFREPLLEGRANRYRACHINKRFKIVYWYDEMKDLVVIEDIWDMHRSPQNLVTRIEK